MIIQLNPTIPLITPKGEGIAHFLIDYGIEHDLYWVTFITETQECWTFSNRDIRACKNITIGRKERPIKVPYAGEVKTPNLNEVARDWLRSHKMGQGNIP
jgi:hypothetical protein